MKTDDIINLYFVSKFYRDVILEVFNSVYFISTGFCSTLQWFLFLEKSCFALVDEIHCSNWNLDLFDYEKLLKKEFRQMSLFSICLHFLRCVRSCDKQKGYCQLCSRVREKFFMECNAFQSLCLTSYGTYLGLENHNRVDLDVFLSQEVPYTFNSNKCCNFQYFKYPQELFACFSSLLIRMFLNCVLKCFNNLLLSLSLHDEKKICHIILRHAQYFLNRFWHESNYCYFYEFFDVFDTSTCFKNSKDKLKFGPCYFYSCSLTVEYH